MASIEGAGESKYILHLYNKNYSSWSWRVWYTFEQLEIPYKAVFYDLANEDSKAKLRQVSPSGLAPCLETTGGIKVWESLAILEFLAEDHPQLWPADRPTRAAARAVAAEMHGGFSQIREYMSANMRRRYAPRTWSPAVQKEVHRVLAVWEECRKWATAGEDDEGFLFGKFCIADAMYAPIVSRFLTYAVDTLEAEYPLANAYLQHIRTSKGWLRLYAEAEKDPYLLPFYENLYPEVLNPEILAK